MTKVKYSSKRERFVNVAEARTQAILNRIRILGNCSNKNLYEYYPEEIDKIFRAIQEQLNETKSKFAKKKDKKFQL
jgi:hypothetical protein